MVVGAWNRRTCSSTRDLAAAVLYSLNLLCGITLLCVITLLCIITLERDSPCRFFMSAPVKRSPPPPPSLTAGARARLMQ